MHRPRVKYTKLKPLSINLQDSKDNLCPMLAGNRSALVPFFPPLPISSRTTTYEDVLLVNWRWLEWRDFAPWWPRSPRAQWQRVGATSGSNLSTCVQKESPKVVKALCRRKVQPQYLCYGTSWKHWIHHQCGRVGIFFWLVLKHFSDHYCYYFWLFLFCSSSKNVSCTGHLKEYNATIFIVVYFVMLL